VVRAPGEPEVVLFIIANGGSNLQDLPGTKEMVIRMIESLPQKVEFGIIFYSSVCVRYPPEGKIARADDGAKKEGIEYVRSILPGHGSCIRSGFDAAFDMIEASGARKVAIVYAGNGYALCGANPETYGREALEEIARRNQGRAAIHAYAWENGDARFLRRLVAMNSGTFTRLSR